MKYSSEEYSDISKRFTDLFADVFTENGKNYKPQIVKVGNSFYEDRLIHRTVRGEIVRSKSEVIIADCLHYNGLEYDYEPDLKFDEQIKRPDFMVTDNDTDEIWYWEHCGMMTNPKYAQRWEEKRKFYEKHGIIEGENMIVTYDDEYGELDSHKIDALIKKTFDL